MRSIKKAGIVCCSDGLDPGSKAQTDELIRVLADCGIQAVCGPYLYARDGVFSGTAHQRAGQLNDFFADDSIDAIFDISGGDLANQILPFLNWPVIMASRAQLWGYSDLTCVLNAIYARTGRQGVLYSVRNLIRSDHAAQQCRFAGFNALSCAELLNIQPRFLRGSAVSGTVVGGNIRCLLKLAGTPCFPDLTGKLLLLEARSGRVPQITAYFSQLAQLGAFEQVSGVLLGTFSQMEEEQLHPTIEELALRFIPGRLPVLKTDLIGHGADSRAIVLGSPFSFDESMT